LPEGKKIEKFGIFGIVFQTQRWLTQLDPSSKKRQPDPYLYHQQLTTETKIHAHFGY